MIDWRKTIAMVEKYLLPAFLFCFEFIFLVVYGLLVRYDEAGSPDVELAKAKEFATAGDSGDFVRELESSLSTTKTYPFFQDVHVMVFVGFGFLMTFLRRYGYSSIGFNLLVASFAIQWSTITTGAFTFITQAQEDLCCTIRVNLETMVGSDFAAAAALITMGAVLGRASPLQLIVITFFELILYSANEAINIHVYEAADIGGSMLIHTFGAYFGLGVSFMLFRKNAKDHSRNSTVYHSDMFAMIGTLFLWLFWPSFNGALASGNGQYRAIINTYYSLTGSVLASVIVSMALSKDQKISMTHIQNATLAGGVAVGSVADMVIQPWGAILIGFFSGGVSVLGYKVLSPLLEKRFRLQDTCGVHNLHGLPGVFSGVASAVAAGVAEMMSESSGKVEYGSSLFLVFPARAPSNASALSADQVLLGVDPGSDRHAGTQAGFQLALLVTTLAISIIGGLLTGFIVNFLPTFNAITDESDYFDDRLYWELADDADNYLPEDNPTTEYQVHDVAARQGIVPTPSSEGAGSIRQRSTPSQQGVNNPIGSVTSVDIKVEEQQSTV